MNPEKTTLPAESKLIRGRKIYCSLYGGSTKVITKFIPSAEPVHHFQGGCISSGGGQIEHINLDNMARSTTPECIIMGVQWTIKDEIMDDSKVATLERIATNKAIEEDNTRHEAMSKTEKRNAEIKARGLLILAEKKPDWAKAAIVAHLENNTSDPYTDYHGHTTEKTVIIGWSKHTRDLFPEMRKAAANCGMEQLKELGPGNDQWRAYLAWDHNSSDLDAKEKRFISNYEAHYYKGCGLDISMDDGKSPVFLTENELDQWLQDKTAPAGTEYKKSVESFEHRQKYSMGGGYFLKNGHRDSSGWKVRKDCCNNLEMIAGQEGGYMVPDDKKKAPAKAAKKTSIDNGGSMAIEEHTHTKKGFQMFICIMAGRVERAEYLELLAKAKELGGWYSRKWRGTPAGFAFKEESAAVEFAGGTSPSAPKPTKTEPKLKPSKVVDLSAKLRTLADKLEDQIENKLADRQTNTAKRLAQAAHARLEGERLQRTQAALNALADMHEAGTVPDVLAKFKSKKAVYDLMGTKKNPVQNGYHGYMVCTGEPCNTRDADAVALWALLSPKTEEQKQEEELQRKIDGLQFSKIPGYFPTPEIITDKMVDYADLEDNQAILEPSAGSGAIMSAIDKAGFNGGRRVAIESNYTLVDILKGRKDAWKICQGDFMEETPQGFLSPGFDRIIMNPPFEKMADIKHIKHALSMLKEGGKLVAICSNGPRQKEQLQPICDHWEELPAGSFKGAGTGVSTVLLVINN